jgi:hypothetical protein
MARSFAIDSEAEVSFIDKEIRDRTLECRVPRCWLLKYPNDKGTLYLDRHTNVVENKKPKGKHVTIRRYLFYMFYGFVPDRHKLTPLCEGGSLCVNPAHMTFKTWNPRPDQIQKLIKARWLSAADAQKWFLGDVATTEQPILVVDGSMDGF